MEEGLSLYDLTPFMVDAIWVCDGGSNLLKALDKFTVVRCVAHRLNNCLQAIFFQSEIMKVKKHILFPDQFNDNSDEEDGLDSGTDEGQNDSTNDREQIDDKYPMSMKPGSSKSNKSKITSIIEQMPSDAKRILVIIICCKELVQYVKKVMFAFSNICFRFYGIKRIVFHFP